MYNAQGSLLSNEKEKKYSAFYEIVKNIKVEIETFPKFVYISGKYLNHTLFFL